MRNVATTSLALRSVGVLTATLTLLLATPRIRATEATVEKLEQVYTTEIEPLLARYCHECHGATDTVEADVNLSVIRQWDDASRQPEVWQKVDEMVSGDLMPPSDSPQPTPEEKAKIVEWLHDYLAIEAGSRAGDPGPVVMRRLSNAEYTYTLRDLTGIPSLDPAREFPVDGAAGEGFTNTGNALVMSPALVDKYLAAAKGVASHAVLLPDGFRFSKHSSPSDWTNETLAAIRDFYGRFTVAGGDHLVAQQGVPLDIGLGGRVPLEKYFAATLDERDALANGSKSTDAVARERDLNAKYLAILWNRLNGKEPSLLLDSLRRQWRAAKPGDEAALTKEVATWQKGLFTFAGVGLIGRVGGPKQWLEPVDPLTAQQEIRLPIPNALTGDDLIFSLVANDAGDGSDSDVVVWEQPRLVSPGRPDLMLRDVRRVEQELRSRREHMLPRVAAYLLAADEVISSDNTDRAAIVSKYGIDERFLQNWLIYLGVGEQTSPTIEGLFSQKLTGVGGHSFINGWGTDATPLVLANSSGTEVRIPGIMRAHGVCVHPSPTQRVATGWRSPITATIQIDANVSLAHPECSNGVTWSLEVRRGTTRQQLAGGIANQQQAGKAAIGRIAVRAGDVISLLVGPLDGNHTCDLTAIDLKVRTEPAGESGSAAPEKTWDLCQDVSSDIHAANPHADRDGTASIWHFYVEPESASSENTFIPANSLLAKWQITGDAKTRSQLAGEVQRLFASTSPADPNSPDAILYRQLNSLGGPLLGSVEELDNASPHGPGSHATERIGIDPKLFGKSPGGRAIDAASLSIQAPGVIKFRLPPSLAAGCELVTNAKLDENDGAEGSVQVRIIAGDANASTELRLSEVTVTQANAQWTDDNRQIASSSPILVAENSAARKRVAAQLDEFRQLFPAALCYTKIVPVDEVVTLILFHREDEHLQRLMLDDAQRQELDRLWNELHYVSQDALKQVDVLEQLLEYASQDADPKAFEPLKTPTAEKAAAFRQALIATEPKHLESLIEFAARAYRRPLTPDEAAGLRELYASLRREEIPHEEAFRLVLARVLVAPAFLYRAEHAQPGTEPSPVSDWELASRLSYFLWSSQPDDELKKLAAEGRLDDPKVLQEQTRRMLRDPKVKRLATEFACQWLHIYDFDQLDEKSDRHFPSFVGLRGAMYKESIYYFTHLFQENASVLDIVSADYTFLNKRLAEYYGIPDVNGPGWRRVDGVKKHSRGGVLTQATTLAKQSGASRTSPILRGNWISEALLGERLPKPPKGVPPLPDDEAETDGLTVRQLVEKHVSDPKCAVCHSRIDAYGFALENYDAVGRFREKDLADRPIDARSTVSDGTPLEGIEGLQNYLLNNRRDAFLRQFCRKLLGYALGRSVQLSDDPLLAEMQKNLEAHDYRVSAAVETIVLSPQFREIRGRDAVAAN